MPVASLALAAALVALVAFAEPLLVAVLETGAVLALAPLAIGLALKPRR